MATPVNFWSLGTVFGLAAALSGPGIAPVQAAWVLDGPSSQVSFLSTKVFPGAASSATEANFFRELSGRIADTGEAQVEIHLDSVETHIPIRNERMRKYLFDTDRFPTAEILTRVPPDLIGSSTATGTLQVTLKLKAVARTFDTPVQVVSLDDGSVLVSAAAPILLDVTAFNLVPGVEKLRELAGLQHIVPTVPVSFYLRFAPDAGAAP